LENLALLTVWVRQEYTHLVSADIISKKFIFHLEKPILIRRFLAPEPTSIQPILLSTMMDENSTCKVVQKILQVSDLFIIKPYWFIEPLNINIRKNIPGPGSYGQGIEINKYGVYRLSTIENSRAAAWSPSKKRFEDDLRHKRQNPGPGDYYPCD